jgi:hypothetical protein
LVGVLLDFRLTTRHLPKREFVCTQHTNGYNKHCSVIAQHECTHLIVTPHRYVRTKGAMKKEFNPGRNRFEETKYACAGLALFGLWYDRVNFPSTDVFTGKNKNKNHSPNNKYNLPK